MISTKIKDIALTFQTDDTLFSPRGIDAGTLAMLSAAEFLPGDQVLDLGCGYGVVGILAAKLIGEENVIMCDISEQAVAFAKRNAALNGVPNIDIRLSDGYDQIGEADFTLILSNPPYHADFSVPKRFIELGFHKLRLGGKLMMVTKRLDWYKNKLISTFGGVTIDRMGEYYVFVAEKRRRTIDKEKKAKTGLSKKLQRRKNPPERRNLQRETEGNTGGIRAAIRRGGMEKDFVRFYSGKGNQPPKIEKTAWTID